MTVETTKEFLCLTLCAIQKQRLCSSKLPHHLHLRVQGEWILILWQLLHFCRFEHEYEVVDVEEPPELPDPNLAQGLDNLSIGRTEVGEEAKEAMEDVDECLVCSERLPLVTFLPCGDKIVCTDCSLKVKKCLKCKEQVESKKIQVIKKKVK